MDATIDNARPPGTMYYMSYDLSLMPTTVFRDEVSEPKLRALLKRRPIVRIGRYAQDEVAVVVEPGMFRELEGAQEALDSLRINTMMLLAAARAGIALPSATLEPLGLDESGWQTLNRFQAEVPFVLTHGEDGEQLARGGLEGAAYVDELEDDLALLDD